MMLEGHLRKEPHTRILLSSSGIGLRVGPQDVSLSKAGGVGLHETLGCSDTTFSGRKEEPRALAAASTLRCLAPGDEKCIPGGAGGASPTFSVLQAAAWSGEVPGTPG